MLKLRLQVVDEAGTRVLRRGPQVVQFAGDAALLRTLQAGSEVEAECAYVAGKVLQAIHIAGLGSEPGSVDEIDALRASGVALGPELVAKKLALLAEARQWEPARECFAELLTALVASSDAFAHVELVRSAWECFPADARAALSTALVRFIVDHRSVHMPAWLRRPFFLPFGVWSDELLFAVAGEMTRELARSFTRRPEWLEDAKVDGVMQELERRAARAEITARCTEELTALRGARAGDQRLARWRAIDDCASGFFEAIEALFEMRLPAALRARWAEALSGERLEPVTFFKPPTAHGKAFELVDLAYALCVTAKQANDRPWLLPIAVQPAASKLLALDLRNQTATGDFPIAELAILHEGVPQTANLKGTAAATSSEWLRALAAPHERQLPGAEPLSTDDTRRIASIRAKLEQRHAKLAAPLEDDELDAFEERHGVRLPAPYRAFLLGIARAGDGPPAYGLVMPTDRARLNVAFPLCKARAYEDGCPTLPGFLELGTDGCGMSWILVVTGHVRGEVWYATEAGYVPCETRCNFLEWYEAWLDDRPIRPEGFD